jgi:hypothetical protein
LSLPDLGLVAGAHYRFAPFLFVKARTLIFPSGIDPVFDNHIEWRSVFPRGDTARFCHYG